jgi:hypothetical protein
MWYTLLNPNERRVIRNRTELLWAGESERVVETQVKFALKKADLKRRELLKDKRFRRQMFRGEMGASAIWAGAALLLNPGPLNFLSRYFATDSFTAALSYLFPVLMRRYLWWVQWLIFFGGCLVIYLALAHVLNADPLQMPEQILKTIQLMSTPPRPWSLARV